MGPRCSGSHPTRTASAMLSTRRRIHTHDPAAESAHPRLAAPPKAFPTQTQLNTMGQQQLILLVLATVIVGLATVVGIRAFSENSIKSNADAMTQDAVRIANDLQAWKQKPAPFGGQASVATAAQTADPADFTGATFAQLGYAAAGGTYTNLNGQFQVDAATGVITGINTQQNSSITVTVDGLTDNDIVGAITCLGGVNPADGAACTAAF